MSEIRTIHASSCGDFSDEQDEAKNVRDLDFGTLLHCLFLGGVCDEVLRPRKAAIHAEIVDRKNSDRLAKRATPENRRRASAASRYREDDEAVGLREFRGFHRREEICRFDPKRQEQVLIIVPQCSLFFR